MSDLSYKQVAWPETPKAWEMVSLGELITKKRETFDDTDFEKLPVKSINNKKGFIDSEEQFDKQVYSEKLGNYSVVRPGEFAYNPARINVGSIAYQDLEEPVLISPMYEVFSVDEERLNPDYFRQFISTEKAISLFESFSQGSIRKNLKFKLMEDIPLALPPLKQQKAISSKLNAIDESIEKTEQVIKSSRQLKRGILADLNSGSKDVGRVLGKPVNIPESWELEKISNLTSKVTDGAHNTPERCEKGKKLLSARNIQEGYIELDTEKVDYVPQSEYDRLKKKCNPQTGDILLTCSGTIGRVARVPEEDEFVMVRSVALLKPDESIDSRYLEQIFASELVQMQIKNYVKKSTQKNLFQKQIKSIKIPVPPLDEQREIAEKLSTVDEKIRQEEEYRDKLEELKKGLMQDLLTGKKRVEV